MTSICREAALNDDRSNLAETPAADGPENQDGGSKGTWQKPALEKLPLNEAQTGSVVGGDSELFS